MKTRNYRYISLYKKKIRVYLRHIDNNPNHEANVDGVELRLGICDKHQVSCIVCTYDDLKRLSKVIQRGLKKLSHEYNPTIQKPTL